MIIKLNGAIVTDPIGGVDDIITNLQRKGSRNKAKKDFTGELQLTGQAFDIVYQALIEEDCPFDNFVTIEILDDCCLINGEYYQAFLGIIKPDTVDYCDGDDYCSVTIQAVEHTDDTKRLDCLESTLVTDNRNGFLTANHPRVSYCVEIRPQFLHDFVIITGWILILILYILTPIIAVISVIVGAINALIGLFGGNPIGFDDDPSTSTLQEYINLINQLKEIIVGCGRQHPSPLVRSYIQNVCDICGLNFTSSIYKDANSDYYNSVYLFAPAQKGTRDPGVKYIFDNRPILSGDLFLDEVSIPFNAEWKVINGTLFLERWDFFNTGTTWLDVTDLRNQGLLIDNQVCYSWRGRELPAYLDAKYTEDALDDVGNEARDLYTEIIEWNNPFNEVQVGSLQAAFPFGMSRYRDDGIDRDVISTYSGAPFFSGIISQYDNVLLMSKGVTALPKLLIWDGVNINNAKIKRGAPAGYPSPGSGNFVYNWPYQCNEFNVSNNISYDSDQANMALLGRFWQINNPKVCTEKGLNVSFSFSYNCDHLANLDMEKTVQTPRGEARIDTIEIDHRNKIMTVNALL